MKSKRIIARNIILLLIVLGSTIIIAKQEQCSILTCQSKDQANGDGDCFAEDAISHQIKMYPNTCEKCNILLSQIIDNDEGKFSESGLDSYTNCSVQNKVFKKYSGEECNDNTDCYSNSCESNQDNKKQCKGLQLSESCDDNQNKFCEQGLTCEENICIETKTTGEACTDSNQCDGNLFCFNEICTETGSISNGTQLNNESDQQQINLQCSSFLLDNSGKCIENDFTLLISSCPSKKKCKTTTSNESFSCHFFITDKTFTKSGGFSQNIQKKLQELFDTIKTKNKYCPQSMKYQSECHLIENEVNQIKEIQTIYNNIHKLTNIPDCLYKELAFKEIYDLFKQQYEMKEAELISSLDNNDIDKNNENHNDNIGDDQTVVLIVIFSFILISILGGGFYYLRRKKSNKQNSFQNSEISDSLPSNRNSSKGSKSSKDKSSNNTNSMNKESLNLEYNPTSAKGENQIDISNIQAIIDPKKNNLKTSVNQNFFSIDGEDDKCAKIEDALDENTSESDVSYENVFNIEGEDVDKPHSARRRKRQANRKKIIKNESDKNYEVVRDSINKV